jgi:23S rRNA pseudouridine2605 synthase
MGRSSIKIGIMRLGKYLAHAGVASRRAAEQLVFDGRVSVRGQTVKDPARDVADGDDVRVDGEPVSVKEHPLLVYMLHKPAGVVSTARDPQGRRTVVDLVPSSERLYPVGRLDADTTGLILLTNDGELANRLTHPRYGVAKVYRVTVANPPVRPADIERLENGVVLEDGRTAPAKARRIASDRFEITIREGRKRQVRRMAEEVGYRVRALERVQLGPLKLGTLASGGHRRLKVAEVEALRQQAKPAGDSRRSRARVKAGGRVGRARRS